MLSGFEIFKFFVSDHLKVAKDHGKKSRNKIATSSEQNLKGFINQSRLN